MSSLVSQNAQKFPSGTRASDLSRNILLTHAQHTNMTVDGMIQMTCHIYCGVQCKCEIIFPIHMFMFHKSDRAREGDRTHNKKCQRICLE